MRYLTREAKLNESYRKVEAMYRRGHNFDEIAKELSLSRIDVLDIVQKIFALDIKTNRI